VAHTGLDPLCRDAMDWVEAHAPPRHATSNDSAETHATDTDGPAKTEE
jgi:hypothetical protein